MSVDVEDLRSKLGRLGVTLGDSSPGARAGLQSINRARSVRSGRAHACTSACVPSNCRRRVLVCMHAPPAMLNTCIAYMLRPHCWVFVHALAQLRPGDVCTVMSVFSSLCFLGLQGPSLEAMWLLLLLLSFSHLSCVRVHDTRLRGLHAHIAQPVCACSGLGPHTSLPSIMHASSACAHTCSA